MKVKILTSNNPQDLENQINIFITAQERQDGIHEYIFNFAIGIDPRGRGEMVMDLPLYSVLITYR